jgi:uncharacterized protein YkwD
MLSCSKHPVFRKSGPCFVILLIFLTLLGTVSCQANSQLTPTALAQATVVPPTATAVDPVEPVTDEPIDPTAVEPTDLPPATETQMPSATPPPTATSSPTMTATPVPTETPLPSPTPVPTLPAPPWLSYLNLFREMADLPPLSDREALNIGSDLHSHYMVVNDDPIAHDEDKENPYYAEAGNQAAMNGNLFATSQLEANYIWSINFWVSAPFHLISMLDPVLEMVGYGIHNEAIGETQMAAVLDVDSYPDGSTDGIEYPIMFPGNGSETWVVRHSMYEWPYPLGNCPGYTTPTGPPIVLFLGDGSRIPNVTSHRFAKGDQVLESCLFDETTYHNDDPYAEGVGRTILGDTDAIVIMPRYELPVDETYSVQVTADGETYTWSFRTGRPPD